MSVGEVVAGRFELVALAGSGGMGRVYRARDRETGRTVALKTMHGSDELDLARFAREATLLASVSHPGVVGYVAHGDAPGVGAFLAMEWLEGEDLESRLARGALGVSDAVALGQRLADAVAALHDRGVIHRDIKPGNVFLPGGDVRACKLLDFGLARASARSRALTAPGSFVGTAMYMAPEQARNDEALGPPVDVFALGCVVFECVAGRRAFPGETLMAVLAKVLLEDPPALASACAGVPRGLSDLVARALAKDPRVRPGDAGALRDALRALETPEGSSRLALTLTGGSQGPRALGAAESAVTDREQRVVSVLLVSDRAPVDVGDASTAEGVGTTALEDAVRGIAEGFGAVVNRLVDGSIVASLAGAGGATDEAARAARCALAVHTAVPAARVALATGSSTLEGRVPVGEAIDRAAALLSHAAGAVRIDPVTAGLLESSFDVAADALGLVLRGQRPLAEAPRTVCGRATPHVGRAKELGLLVATWGECQSDAVARAVLVTGPPGAGKSRLRQEFVAKVREGGGPLEVWSARGDPLRAGTAYELVGQLVRDAAGLRPGEPLAAWHHRLRARAVAANTGADIERLAVFLGELAGAPFPDEASMMLRAARQDPVLLGDQLRRAWLELACPAREPRPLLVVIEDLHWADPPSVSLLEALLAAEDRAVMVLALARPEVHQALPAGLGRAAVQEIRLAELSRRAAGELVRSVLGATADEAAVARVVAHGEGNPLYLEEIARAIAEGNGDALPTTVLAMVQARLAALPAAARRALRAASVFGERFARAGVADLVGGGEAEAAVAVLTAREVVAPAAAGDEDVYVFRHALIRDAAYAMLPEADRVAAHARAAAWLEAHGEADAAVLAEHYERASEGVRAGECWVRAAEQALRVADLPAARARVARAEGRGLAGESLGRLRLAQAVVASWRADAREALVYAREAQSLLPRGGEAWLQAAAEGVTAASQCGEHEAVAPLAAELRAVTAASGEHTTSLVALSRAASALALSGHGAEADALEERVAQSVAGRNAPDPRVDAWIHRARARKSVRSGNMAGALGEFWATVKAFEAAGDLRAAMRQRLNLGDAYRALGGFKEARDVLREALEGFARLGLEQDAAIARLWLASALLGTRETDAALAAARAGAAVLANGSELRLGAAARVGLADVLLARGELVEAETLARRALTVAERYPLDGAAIGAVLAEVLLAAGRTDECLEVTRAALAARAEHGTLEENEVRLLVTHARALHARGDADGARAALAEAIARVRAVAATITDARWRRCFLENVREHGEAEALARAWA